MEADGENAPGLASVPQNQQADRDASQSKVHAAVAARPAPVSRAIQAPRRPAKRPSDASFTAHPLGAGMQVAPPTAAAAPVRIPSSVDSARLFQRALDLLASPAPESEVELLDLCKKVLRETQAGPQPAKRPRAAGVGGPAWSAGEPMPAHASAARPTPSAPGARALHGGASTKSADVAALPGPTPSATPLSSPLSAAGLPVPKGSTQQRLMQAMKGGFKPGRSEKVVKRRPGR